MPLVGRRGSSTEYRVYCMSNEHYVPSLGTQAYWNDRGTKAGLEALSKRVIRIEKFLRFRAMRQHPDLKGKVLDDYLDKLLDERL